jgi:thioredoxin reductase (NADPH)
VPEDGREDTQDDACAQLPTTNAQARMSESAASEGGAWAALSAPQLSEVTAFGREQPTRAGQLLFQAGEDSYDLFVVLDGEIEVVRRAAIDTAPIATYGPGGFAGELNLLTGQRRTLDCRVTRAGRVLVIPEAEFRRLMSSRPALAEVIFDALLARRELLRTGDGAQAIRIVGSRYSPAAMRLRAFAEHSHLAHAWIDVEDAEDLDVTLASLGLTPRDIPAVITATEILRRPSAATFAEHLGLTFRPTPGYIFDLVVVGSGPAGLAAAVYGASEGLRTVSLDALAIGGQAGMSSRIENYAGFPNGISGEALTGRAAVQAMRLGARLNAPCEVIGLRTESGFHVIVLADGSEIPTRAVIVASGARYQRLAVAELDRFEGAGVYYAATDLEARVCNGTSVLVIGGGNSAGQAALYLAQSNCGVTIAIRREDLAQSMSQYLIERIEADPKIDLLTGVEVQGLAGQTRLEQVTLKHTTTGREQTTRCAGLFCFIGARPATAWLKARVMLDRDGFVLTDRQLPEAPSAGTSRALPFETSLPGVFAAGDVRHGSMKRVAAAVGEGSSAVRSVHERLASEI